MNYEVRIIFFFILIYISTSIFLWDACSILSTQKIQDTDKHHIANFNPNENGTNQQHVVLNYLFQDNHF